MTDEQVSEIRDAFNMYDKERKGEIPTSILGTVMKNLGHNLKPDQLADCIDAVDGDGKSVNDEKQSNQFSFPLSFIGSGTVDFVCLSENDVSWCPCCFFVLLFRMNFLL